VYFALDGRPWATLQILSVRESHDLIQEKYSSIEQMRGKLTGPYVQSYMLRQTLSYIYKTCVIFTIYSVDKPIWNFFPVSGYPPTSKNPLRKENMEAALEGIISIMVILAFCVIIVSLVRCWARNVSRY